MKKRDGISNNEERANFIQANVNGRLCDARAASISPLDRSFLHGDSVYEVWRTYGGSLFAWEPHWQRLMATADGIGLVLDDTKEDVLSEIRRTVEAWKEATGRSGDVYIRLQFSRGVGEIGLDTRLAEKRSFVIYVKGLMDLPEEALDRGMRLAVGRKWKRNSSDALPPSLKTGNYLNNILGLSEARARGADDVVFLNSEGRITEASTRNIWFVFRDRISTPQLSDGLLAGVTRKVLLEEIRQIAGRPLLEDSLSLDDLSEADECFLSSSTQDVQPVAAIDGQEFAVGSDTISRTLKKAFREHVEVALRETPYLRLF